MVRDREKLQEYLRLSQHTLAPYGGQFHVQAGDIQVLEGGWAPKVIIIAEFPSMEKAREWYDSEDYAQALVVKPQAISRNMILVEGLS